MHRLLYHMSLRPQQWVNWIPLNSSAKDAYLDACGVHSPETCFVSKVGPLTVEQTILRVAVSRSHRIPSALYAWSRPISSVRPDVNKSFSWNNITNLQDIGLS
jgi:hypothetical protein